MGGWLGLKPACGCCDGFHGIKGQMLAVGVLSLFLAPEQIAIVGWVGKEVGMLRNTEMRWEETCSQAM